MVIAVRQSALKRIILTWNILCPHLGSTVRHNSVLFYKRTLYAAEYHQVVILS